MTTSAAPGRKFFGLVSAVGRFGFQKLRYGRSIAGQIGSMWDLLRRTVWFCVRPVGGFRKLKRQLFPLMSNVGVRSWPIVSLVSMLIGLILVLQTGHVMKRYGQIQEVPGLVALSMCRELGPLMTCILLTARVGASFTAVLGSMKINEEVLALETMAINPIGYLVSPRLLSMVFMVPCLTVFSYLVGLIGGAIASYLVYDISGAVFVEKTVFYLSMTDVVSGLGKSLVFGVLITIVCCYYGLKTEGGSMGLGRNTMVAVVTAIVVIVAADMLMTAFFTNYLLPYA